jgi:anti-sigma factor RsiW
MSPLRGASATGRCLGDVAAALIDGELSHAGRERAHRHLAHCAGCRAEVDAERRLKLRLHGLAEVPVVGEPLAARLLAVASGDPTAPGGALTASSPATRSTRSRRRTSSGPPGGRPRNRSHPRRRTLGGAAFVALGLTAAFALGGPSEPPSTVVDPGTDAFVTEYVSTSSDLAPARRATLTTGVHSGR